MLDSVRIDFSWVSQMRSQTMPIGEAFFLSFDNAFGTVKETVDCLSSIDPRESSCTRSSTQ
jgi:hypothetical protein